MSFDGREFRTALGYFPTGVIIATAFAEGGEPIGMTMSSFNSVSLDPPLVLFSIHRESSSFSQWQKCTRYAINVLADDQEELSNRFASSKGRKWEGMMPTIGRTGVPYLGEAPVSFECEAYAAYDGGDHEIFVARVLEIRKREGKDELPLLFYGGRYRKLANAAHPHQARIEDGYLYGW
ncbi:flavin reductase family protein [Bradyrhizobium sp. dw_78]|uniref:flavin reductase family protein n=1 Tax=Bradyrhizobium sp. dw_78 TaxID=2719793 RepID=UPI00201C18CF|nr:flavin reductase family protein [Bradyrhizobium sp. dw_78]